MWWTTGVAYDTGKITDTPDQQQGALGPALRQAHRDARRLAGGASGWRCIQLGYDANSSDLGQLDEALALLEQQKPLVRKYSTDTGEMMSSGDIWIGQVWGSDIYSINQENPKMTFYIPEEGAVRGLGHHRDLLGRPSTRSPRTCSSTTCSTRR